MGEETYERTRGKMDYHVSWNGAQQLLKDRGTKRGSIGAVQAKSST